MPKFHKYVARAYAFYRSSYFENDTQARLWFEAVVHEIGGPVVLTRVEANGIDETKIDEITRAQLAATA